MPDFGITPEQVMEAMQAFWVFVCDILSRNNYYWATINIAIGILILCVNVYAIRLYRWCKKRENGNDVHLDDPDFFSFAVICTAVCVMPATILIVRGMHRFIVPEINILRDITNLF